MVLRNVVPRQGTETVWQNETIGGALLLRNVVPRQGTETSHVLTSLSVLFRLRNVVPRQGTETVLATDAKQVSINIEKCSSPTGDGNSVCFIKLKVICTILRNVVPRQGTETLPRAILSRSINTD